MDAQNWIDKSSAKLLDFATLTVVGNYSHLVSCDFVYDVTVQISDISGTYGHHGLYI